mmetsp:Transcript_79407/g.241001  ORF Transcript_79407/g.241001 Transcript_79407/m.241001 type:complete len:168 (+) Transcript_79407:57-560(+)
MTHELRDKQIAFTWCSHVGIDDVVFASKLEKALLKAGAAAVHVIHDEERAVAATNSDVLVMIGRDERWASQWTVREANLPVQIKTAPVIRIQPKKWRRARCTVYRRFVSRHYSENRFLARSTCGLHAELSEDRTWVRANEGDCSFQASRKFLKADTMMQLWNSVKAD